MTAAGLALALTAGYLVLVGVVRPLVQLRRTGSTGVVGIGGHTGPAGLTAALLGVVGFGLALAAPVLVLRDLDEPLAAVDSVTVQVVGTVTMLLGIALTFAAQLAMGASWRIGVDASERTALVTSGLFGWVRNPIYSGMLVTLLGLVLLLPTLLTVAALAALTAAIEIQVRLVEEPYLHQVHGADFAAYCRRVGRLVPGLGRS